MCYKLCNSKKVVLDGKEIILRNPTTRDVNSLLELINSLVEEDAQILVNKKYTLKEEKAWLKEQLKSIRKDEGHLVIAEYKNEIIGGVEIKHGKWRSSHVGTLGINVKKDYRRIGLGKALMKMAIDIAKKDNKIKVLELGVFETNEIAFNLYKKLGFKTVAKLPKRFFYKGKYVNDYIMDYQLKKI